MTDHSQSHDQGPLTTAPFTPSEADLRALAEWFVRYDTLVREGKLEAMADMALFPLVVISHDAAGECVSQDWDRATFLQAMNTNLESEDFADVTLDNRREPTFLSADLAIVTTDAEVRVDGQSQYMRYVDVLVKQGGQWRFKSMVQAGWGDMLKRDQPG